MSYLPIDLMTSEIRLKRRLKTSTLDSFSAAGASGMAYARTIPFTIGAGQSNCIKLQKNSNVAVRFVRAAGLYIDAVDGVVSGDIIGLFDLISTNGVTASDFAGSIELYNAAAIGDIVLGQLSELSDSFYPDGQFVIELKNNTEQSISTFLSIGVEQITEAGAFTILEPGTQLEPTTEMSTFNGLN
jgi:hypothetical protein